MWRIPPLSDFQYFRETIRLSGYKRDTLFFDIARIAQYHKPKVLFLENVKNFVKHDNGNTLQVILNTLDSIGYDTYFSILNASNFGVPQKRERVYFVSFRKDLRIKSFQFPTSNGIYSTLKDVCLPDKDTAEFIINREDVTFKDHILLQQDILGHYPQKPIRIGQVNKGGQGGERIYHELGHAITLSADGGGVGAKTGLYLINGKIRKLAPPRECARITGFPDTFKLHSNKNVSYKQFGNSVVTNVLEAVLANIFNTISF